VLTNLLDEYHVETGEAQRIVTGVPRGAFLKAVINF
jgi:hypothetical protein